MIAGLHCLEATALATSQNRGIDRTACLFDDRPDAGSFHWGCAPPAPASAASSEVPEGHSATTFPHLRGPNSEISRHNPSLVESGDAWASSGWPPLNYRCITEDFINSLPSIYLCINIIDLQPFLAVAIISIKWCIHPKFVEKWPHAIRSMFIFMDCDPDKDQLQLSAKRQTPFHGEPQRACMLWKSMSPFALKPISCFKTRLRLCISYCGRIVRIIPIDFTAF